MNPKVIDELTGAALLNVPERIFLDVGLIDLTVQTEFKDLPLVQWKTGEQSTSLLNPEYIIIQKYNDLAHKAHRLKAVSEALSEYKRIYKAGENLLRELSKTLEKLTIAEPPNHEKLAALIENYEAATKVLEEYE